MLSFQAVSQTEWITVYKIFPREGSRLNFTVNIIDTPGYSDTRGLDQDNKTTQQVGKLFSARGVEGVAYIDAVCFIVKAPDARLTPVQKYIFTSIMDLFGKDIESNICTLITFCSCVNQRPGVIAALEKSKFKFGKTFNFNNEVLSAEHDTSDVLLSAQWDMNTNSFDSFFQYIKELKTRSLLQSQEVLDKRESIKTKISIIKQQIDTGLANVSEIREERDTLKKFEEKIKENENFRFFVEETKLGKMHTALGYFATNCTICKVSCHEDCQIQEKNQMRKCLAIDKQTGHCLVCPKKCSWLNHECDTYVYRMVLISVEKTYAEMKKKYKEAKGKTISLKQCIQEKTQQTEERFNKIKLMMDEINECMKTLNDIALRPDPFPEMDYLDLMIESEKREKQPGYDKRLEMLEEMKASRNVKEKFKHFETVINDKKASKNQQKQI